MQMEQAMFGKLALSALALLLLGAAPAPLADRPGASKDIAKACGTRDGWAEPAPPAHIHGQTWYVGTCGITVVLVDTGAGLVLIDTGPQEAVPHVLASIRALGFDPKRIRWILSTHEHFDHVGGLAAMQRETGADVVTGPFIGDALRSGRPFPDDPQAAELAEKPMEPVKVTRTLRDNGSVFTSDPRFTAHATPTHSPGSTSWTWRSCDQDGCKTIAYADSNSTISSDGYRFSDNPRRISSARYGLGRIAAMPCDILITPHPGSSNLLERLSGRGTLVDAGACKAYAESGMKRLDQRLEKEGPAK
nr:subclass B3 metallo-beta-lactamase [uncultured bacterium]